MFYHVSLLYLLLNYLISIYYLMQQEAKIEDKTSLKVFKFPDNSVYYGEVAYVDENGKLVNI